MVDSRFVLFGFVAVALVALAGVYLAGSPGTARVDWSLGAAPAESGGVKSVEVTVYNTPDYYYGGYGFSYSSGLALVKEQRTAMLAQGLNELAISGTSASIDPTSIYFQDLTDADASVLEQNYDFDLLNQDKLLEKNIGERVTVHAGNATFSGTLLAHSNGVILETESGIVSLNSFDWIEYDGVPEGLFLKPTISWLLNAGQAGEHDLRVSYLTSGLNWHAEYVAIASEADDSLDLQAWVSVENNAGVSFEDAKLKLVAGDINLVQDYVAPYPSYDSYYESSGGAGVKQVSEEALFEYHLYTVEHPVTLANNQVKQISLLSAESVPAVKELVFQPSQSDSVQVKILFDNREASGLGVPLPAGKVRVYKPDSTGQLQFLGEDEIEHTAKDEEVSLLVGNAFDILASRVQTGFESLGSCQQQVGYNVTITNHKTAAVTVNFVDDSLWSDWEIVSESWSHVKEDANTASWEFSVPADAARSLVYSVRTRYC